jgi:hypothetical protein
MKDMVREAIWSTQFSEPGRDMLTKSRVTGLTTLR